MARSKGDINAFAKMLSTFARGAKIAKEENTAPEYGQIVPQQFTVTTDPSVAGFKRIPNIQEKARRLLQKYAAETEEPIAAYEEVKEEARNGLRPRPDMPDIPGANEKKQ